MSDSFGKPFFNVKFMEKQQINAHFKKMLADTITPVATYMKVRDHYSDPVLLESNNFQSAEDCHSFIGLDTLFTFEVSNGQITTHGQNIPTTVTQVTTENTVAKAMQQFVQNIQVTYEQPYNGVNGLFGHTNFDSVQYFDSLKFDAEKRKMKLPDMRYSFYRFVIGFDHFKDKITVVENLPIGEESRIDELTARIKAGKMPQFHFELQGRETSNITDEAFKELVRVGKHHCQIGDVFQIVLSRQYQHKFRGDDFNVYRILRSVNPSPYLYYFDFGDYHIFGSSPETQMQIQDRVARVNPIAGTYRRTGDVIQDLENTQLLKEDAKENAEHIMLVDLARNDLGRHTHDIEVKELKQVQLFSHVIHLVSRVEGKMNENTNPFHIFADTFPAGTLSGAPKYKALQLIDHYENQNRGIYGGALGYIDLAGNMNQAIVIRSFFSQNKTLYYQAGAGIVVNSNEENELQEVKNKLGALTRALHEAAAV